MDIGVCIASHIGDIDYAVRAEALGFSHAWLADSQMIWSDCYATLALVADKTEHIKIGTGVAISGTRPAPNNASGIATINALAPGRTFFGIGAGNTAMRIMGLPPQKIREFDQYLSEISPLLKGEESQFHHQDKTLPIRHIMPEQGFVNFHDPIPMYVSGFGPKSLGLAGQHGNGAVISLPGNASMMENVWQMIEAGADRVQRKINRDDFYITALNTMVVLDDGEPLDSERVRRECGAFVMASVHYAYDQWRNFGHQPRGVLHEIWDDYVALLESYPEDRRHQRIHAGHNCWVLPEEEQFVTAELIEATCMVGTKEQLVHRLKDLSSAGLDQVMILPNFESRFEVLERVAKDIIPAVR